MHLIHTHNWRAGIADALKSGPEAGSSSELLRSYCHMVMRGDCSLQGAVCVWGLFLFRSLLLGLLALVNPPWPLLQLQGQVLRAAGLSPGCTLLRLRNLQTNNLRKFPYCHVLCHYWGTWWTYYLRCNSQWNSFLTLSFEQVFLKGTCVLSWICFIGPNLNEKEKERFLTKQWLNIKPEFSFHETFICLR